MAKKKKSKKIDIRRKGKSRRKKSSVGKRKYLILVVFLALVSLLAFLFYKEIKSASTVFKSDKYYVKGIDVSHHNTIVNWNTLWEQNISFAILKATEGTTRKDRDYATNYKRAKEVNIKVGSYHFYSFAVSGKEQAKHFIKTATNLPGDIYPSIDVEHSPANPYSTDTTYRARVVGELKILESELYNHFGVRPIIYTNRDCYKLYVKNNFKDNYIWLSDLINEPSDALNWRIWQYSHSGTLQGVIGPVDLNYYKYSFEQFQELLLP